MSQRRELVALAKAPGAKVAQLCRRFGVSRKTAYKWLARERERPGEAAALLDRSRRPRRSPSRTEAAVEQAVVKLRGEHPAWGGRKLRARLMALGREPVPSASTITRILGRRGLLDPGESAKHTALIRFEHQRPNDLWQMDFKGSVPLAGGGGRRRCHPLTVLDDHSRYCVGLRACADERGETVRGCLVGVFRRYGLPARMLMDNGSPWGDDAEHPYTPLTVWLLRLGIAVGHGRAYHPQTQGKDERFHRTLKAEVLCGREHALAEAASWQGRFDRWRGVYNLERPHEALAMAVPASRYRPSERSYPEVLGEIEYAPGDQVRRVGDKGSLRYAGRVLWVSKAFKGEPVALRPTARDGIVEVYYCREQIAELDLSRQGRTATLPRASWARGAGPVGSGSGPARDRHGRVVH